ncbi:MAG TPA: metallophosphoesterase [Polyangiaceae bacterium]|jgi:hypothetical protein
MRGLPWLVAALALVGVGGVGFACGGGKTQEVGDDCQDPDGGPCGTAPEGDASPQCTVCSSDGDCNGESCVTLPSGSYCAPLCNTSNDCSSDTSCAPVNSVATGAQVGACVPRGGACGIAPVGDDGGGPAVCGSFAGPSVDAGCACPSGKTCSANGCRYQQYCETTTNTCQPAPIGCGTAGSTYDAGAAPTGTVGPTGGSLSRLYFAIVGDTRPPNEDDTSGYPTSIITQIYGDLEALSPTPAFVVATGDYQFASTTGTQSTPQLDLYMGARAKYSGTVFPAMGNHECTGATASNCGTGNTDGLTPNYDNFVSMLLAPIQQTSPYYEIDVSSAAGAPTAWTAKFLFLAANAWTQTQANWLDAAMGKTTTYTFIVRHESASANTAPGVSPSEVIMSMHPYTLAIVGHTHSYQRSGPKEVIIGNGGAPLSGGVDYGFGMVSQQDDGSIAVDVVDYTTGLADSSFHFALNPDGSSH